MPCEVPKLHVLHNDDENREPPVHETIFFEYVRLRVLIIL